MRGTRGASQQFMPVHIQAGGWIPGLTLFSSFRPSWPFMLFPSLLELLTGNSCRQRPRHPWEEGSPPSLPGPAGAACAPRGPTRPVRDLPSQHFESASELFRFPYCFPDWVARREKHLLSFFVSPTAPSFCHLGSITSFPCSVTAKRGEGGPPSSEQQRGAAKFSVLLKYCLNLFSKNIFL